MKYRQLGDSALQVSEIALGTWLTYGVTVGKDQARACVDRAFAHGINFVDTANMYGNGATEALLGELLAAYPRQSYLLATKVFYPMSPDDRGLSRGQIHKQVDASLKRLNTDYVDLYQCHSYDDDTPLEETMEALSEVVRAGKARYIGCSNWKPRQILRANQLAGVERFVSNQPQYSMLRRQPERRLFPVCAELGIGQIVWSPLAQGVLTGKYTAGRGPMRDTRAGNKKIRNRIRRLTAPPLLAAVDRLRPIAEELSVTLPQLALAWVLRQPCVSAAIIGASRPEQIDENVGAVGVELAPATIRRIDTAVADVAPTEAVV